VSVGGRTRGGEAQLIRSHYRRQCRVMSFQASLREAHSHLLEQELLTEARMCLSTKLATDCSVYFGRFVVVRLNDLVDQLIRIHTETKDLAVIGTKTLNDLGQ
jgi:hypothetical protein